MALCGQVMKGYLRHLRKGRMLVWAGGTLVFALMGLAGITSVQEHGMPIRISLWSLFMLSMAVMYAFNTWQQHLKEELGMPTAWLVPHFQQTHCLVGAVFCAMSVLVMAAAFQWWVGVGGLEVAAFLGLFTAIHLWSTLKSRWLLVMLAIWGAMGAVGYMAQDPGVWTPGEHPLPAAGLLVLAIAWAAVGFRRLAHLHAEDKAYQWFTDQRAKKEIHINIKWMERMASRFPLERLWEERKDTYPLSTWAAARRFACQFSGLRLALPVTGLLLIPCVVITAWEKWHDMPPGGYIFMVSFFAVFPMIFIGREMVLICQRMEIEGLYPLERETFLRGLGWASLWVFLQWWLLLAGVMVVFFMLSPPSWSGLQMAAMLLCLLAIQILAWGSLCWILRWTRRWEVVIFVLMGVMMIIYLGVIVPSGMAAQRLALYPNIMIGCVLLMMLAGVLLAHNAYRRWLQWEAGR